MELGALTPGAHTTQEQAQSEAMGPGEEPCPSSDDHTATTSKTLLLQGNEMYFKKIKWNPHSYHYLDTLCYAQ